MPKVQRTRFASKRECELDMRCLVRDWKDLRTAQDKIGKIVENRRFGRPYDEIELARLSARKNRLIGETTLRFDRLLNRMNRIRADD